jgi:Rrf2 family protein
MKVAREIISRKIRDVIKLRQANIVKGIQGPRGGYMLAKDPDRIMVRDIIKAMEEPTDIVFCVDNPTKCKRAKQCITRLVWKEATERNNIFFDSISIDDLCERGKEIGIKRDVKHSFDYSI